MDLMSASTSFALLKKKYRNFRAPTVRIEVDGTEITQKKGAHIQNVEVELTSEFSASGCGFDVLGQYEPEQTAFASKGVQDLLQLGAKVELSLGYIVTEMVFSGLVAEVEYVFGDEDISPYIHVECIDAKFLLMKQQRLELFSEKSVSDAVGVILSEQPVSNYLSGKQIDSTTTKYDMIPAAMEDDYSFVVRYASYIGHEFFIIQGKAYFRKPPAMSSPILTVSPNNGIQKAKISLRGSGLYKKADVRGINPLDDKEISGTADIKGKFSKKSTASQMISGSVKTYFDHLVTSADEAGDRARKLIENAQNDFGRIECKCVGLPEIVPGRSVKVRGLMPDANQDCYVLAVRHSMNMDGFVTTFEARIDKL